MEIEKTLLVAAPAERVWSTLLDPKVMAGCMPGVQSVEVLSDTEYVAAMKVKVSFISANFRMRTTIVETRPPHYLRCEGTGEDSSVASTVTQTSEMFLTPQADGSTELRVKVTADVVGRLGSFGIGMMKTKADRMWEEFGDNFAALFRPSAVAGAIEAAAPVQEAPAVAAIYHEPPAETLPVNGSRARWWDRWLGRGAAPGNDIRTARLPTDIYIEVHRAGDVIRVLWPSSDSSQATAWLKTIPAEKSQ